MTNRSIPFEGVIFDMDGLLVDSERIWHLAETDFVAARGEVYTDDVRESIIGTRLDAMMKIVKEHYGFEEPAEDLIADLVDRMVTLIPNEVAAQPGAQEMIDFVRETGLPFGLASSSAMVIIEATLKAQGWMDIFVNRYTADDDALGKPHPDVYLRAAREIGVDPAHCLALEDSPTGARAAVAAGMTCFAVPDPTHATPEAFAGITPHVFGSLHEVISHLKGNE